MSLEKFRHPEGTTSEDYINESMEWCNYLKYSRERAMKNKRPSRLRNLNIKAILRNSARKAYGLGYISKQQCDQDIAELEPKKHRLRKPFFVSR